MLSTLSNTLGGGGLQAQLGRGALCAALPLLQRMAATTAAAGIHEAAAASSAEAAGLHEAAAAHQQHHKPAYKNKASFSITPFLAKPGQGRRASVDAVEWSDRLRRLDFGLPRGPRYARNVAAASPCKPIASAHPGFRHSHHELNKGIASHLEQPHFQASFQ